MTTAQTTSVLTIPATIELLRRQLKPAEKCCWCDMPRKSLAFFGNSSRSNKGSAANPTTMMSVTDRRTLLLTNMHRCFASNVKSFLFSKVGAAPANTYPADIRQSPWYCSMFSGMCLSFFRRIVSFIFQKVIKSVIWVTENLRKELKLHCSHFCLEIIFPCLFQKFSSIFQIIWQNIFFFELLCVTIFLWKNMLFVTLGENKEH